LTDASVTVDAGAPDNVWVSLAEAAKHQKVSRQAVHKRVRDLVSAGRLSTRPGPRGTVLINLVAYMRAVREETDPAQYLRNGIDAPLFAEPDEDPRLDTTDPLPDGPLSDGASYQQARARREAFNAENARLDLEERIGRLVDRDDVEDRTMTAFRKIRDRLLSLPATLADRLIAQPDAASMRVALDKEIRAVLEAAAHELDALGADEADDE